MEPSLPLLAVAEAGRKEQIGIFLPLFFSTTKSQRGIGFGGTLE